MRALESQQEGMLCSLLLYEERSGVLKHGAAPSLPDSYNGAIDGISVGPKVGSCGTAAHRRESVYVADIATDPLWADFRDLALAIGVRACWSTPIFDPAGSVLGTFAIYAREPGLPGPEHLELIAAATHTASICLAHYRAEEALRDKTSRLDLALTAAGMGVWDWVLATNQLYWSEQTRAILGVPFPTDLSSFNRLVHPDDLAGLHQAVAECIQERTDYKARFRFYRGDGSLRWAENQGRALYSEEGVPLKVTGIIRDVTESVEAEEARVSLEAQLRQAQKMEALGTLAGGIAHDFNNALHVMLGHCELGLLEATGSLADSLRQIDQAGRRAQQLVRQILTMSRREAPNLKPLALSAVAESGAALLRSALPARVEVHCVVDRDLPPILGDESLLQQVLLNLGTNAWQADAERITLGVAAAPEGQLLCFSDNGSGMPTEVLERVFEPFFTTKPAGQGTGLGLSAVHGIVTGHGGSVAVESAPGQGTTFRLTFPSAPVADAVPGPPPEKRSAGAGEMVVIVDDQSEVLHLADRILSRAGYTVLPFTAPDQALGALRTSLDVSLLVTDYNMPGMSGLELCQAAHELYPQLRMILCSGYLTLEIKAAARAAGVGAFVDKPFTADMLVEAVAEMLL